MKLKTPLVFFLATEITQTPNTPKKGQILVCCTVTIFTHQLSDEVALQRAEMRMVRWMCNVKLKDRVPIKELRDRLGIDDVYW